MWRQLKDTVEDKGAALEEDVSPVPAVVFDPVVSFGLDPQIKSNKRQPANPATHTVSICANYRYHKTYRITCVANERPSGTRKEANANMQYATKSLQD